MNRILHVLDHSRPIQSGYASRSHSILTALSRDNASVVALTSPKHGPSDTKAEQIDGIEYIRSSTQKNIDVHGPVGQLRSIMTTRRALQQILKLHDVAVIHAHSPCLNGLAAIGLGKPLVYEMRSSWEDAAVSEGQTREGTLRYRVSRFLETFVAKRATALTVICEGLKSELEFRGIPSERISVVPNALSDSMFAPSSNEDIAAAKRKYRLDGKKVIGYFGSFFEWEGIESLISALPDILSKHPEVIVLLAGGGRTEASVKELVQRLGLEKSTVFAGRVPSQEIQTLYQCADVMVYPRISHRLTEMVTPLKPLEAMAQCTPVVASDIGGHRELIENGKTGFLYDLKDSTALANVVNRVLEFQPVVDEVVQQARRYVESERRWSDVVAGYKSVYANIVTDETGTRLNVS